MIMNDNANTNKIDIYELFKDKFASSSFFTDAYDAVSSRAFIDDVKYNERNACNYLEILETFIKSLNSATPLDVCKIEAFMNIHRLYEGLVDTLKSDINLTLNQSLSEKWTDVVNDRINTGLLKLTDALPEDASDTVCEIVYVSVFEHEITHLLALRNLCLQENIKFPDYEEMLFEAFTAIYNYYEETVREFDYEDGDFESPECQEFYQRWQLALAEKLC